MFTSIDSISQQFPIEIVAMEQQVWPDTDGEEQEHRTGKVVDGVAHFIIGGRWRPVAHHLWAWKLQTITYRCRRCFRAYDCGDEGASRHEMWESDSTQWVPEVRKADQYWSDIFR